MRVLFNQTWCTKRGRRDGRHRSGKSERRLGLAAATRTTILLAQASYLTSYLNSTVTESLARLDIRGAAIRLLLAVP